jgi:S1-C subfamily serine protease
VRVFGRADQWSVARILASDAGADLALLGTDLRPTVVARLRLAPAVSVGEPVFVTRFAGADLHVLEMATGVVADRRLGNLVIAELDPIAGPGDSGGALLDGSGRVLGVIFAGSDPKSRSGQAGLSVYGYATPAITVDQFLTRNGIARQGGASAGQGPEGVAGHAEQLAVQVVCKID